MYQKILVMFLLIFLLFPSFSMSGDGNVPVVKEGNLDSTRVIDGVDSVSIFANKSEKHKKFVLMFEKMLEDKEKVIPYIRATGKIQWCFDDDISKLYFMKTFLEYGENSLKVEILQNHMHRIEEYDGNFPITYIDSKNNRHVISREWFTEYLKTLSNDKDPFLKISACRALIGFDYWDDEIIKNLKYYALGTDMYNWNIESGPRYINNLNSKSKQNQYSINPNSKVEDIELSKEDLRIISISALHKLNNKKSHEEIRYLFINLLSSNPTPRLKEKLQQYLRNINSDNDNGSNMFEDKSTNKAIGKYLDIWDPNSSKAYCDQFWGPDTTNYNTASYHTLSDDCANFGSQCLIAGGLDLSEAVTYWDEWFGTLTEKHPCNKTTITLCDYLNNFLSVHRNDFKISTIDFTLESQAVQENPHAQIPQWFRTGDIALLGESGVHDWVHTIINHGGNGTDASFGCHTEPRHDKFLNFEGWIYYFDGVNYGAFDYITFYHVIGSTALKSPSEDELTVQIGDTLDFRAIVTNNTEPTSLNPITNFKYILKKKPENTLETLYDTSNPPSAIDSTYIFSFNTASQDTGSYVLYAKTTYTEGITQDSCFLKIKPIPEVIYPTPDDIILIKPPGKAIATDTLDIKIRVPEVLGSYPNIKLKIDGVYVEQNDIVLEDSIYVYPWILNTVTSDPLGKRIKVEPELFDDPNCKTSSDILTVEAVFLETFQEVTDLETEGWNVTEYAYPLYTCATNGWMIGPDPTYVAGEKCGRTYSTNSTSFIYQLYTPAFTVPDSSISKTKLEYKLYFKYNMIPYSYIYFDVCNESGTPLTSSQMLGPAYGLWTNMNYDLSDYSNQTIKLRWKHNYTDGMQNCYFTQYAIDNVAIYRIPDMDSPSIDFVHDNQAYVNNDMVVRLEFNDDSDIQSVTADYEIEGDSDTITLTQSKDTYFYSGTIPARDHVCYGSIVFKIKDTVGNETVSEPYSISWIEPGGTVLTTPQNVVITAQTDSTFALTWDMVSGASGYKVYSSLDPYGVFSEDTTGTFTESRKWEKLFDGNKYFYYIIATDAAKDEVLEIIKPREIR